MPDYKSLDSKAIKLGKQIVKMCTAAGSGHPSTAMSLLHLTTALMYRVMRYDPKNPWNKGSDRLVLSEGHGVPVVYAAYCELGGIVGTQDQPSELRFDDALTLREGDSVLDGHPNPAVGFPFFDAATGSLGQGLSVAAGLASGARVAGSDAKMFCMCGDGESREGQIWEALDYIADHKLTNVYAIFNCNGQGQSDYVSPQQTSETLTAKLTAFGFDVKVIDGHDWEQIIGALTAAAGDKPIAIVANTIKGWGVNGLQDRSCHGKVLDAEGLLKALADLDAKAAELGAAEVDGAGAADIPAAAVIEAPAIEEISGGSFEDALKAVGWEGALDAKTLSTRKAYGAALMAIGANPRIVGIDADVKNSTFSEMFAKKYVDRYFEARIAEQNMISVGAGIAASGRVPFISTFAKFFSRAYDQIEMAGISHANIKLCGSHAGISLGADGPSQMSLPDLAFFRSIAHSRRRTDGAPVVRVMLPSDAVSTFKLTELMANVEGMCYMRTHRPDVPFIYDFDEEFTEGGFKHLIDGEDIAIVASGYMVHVAKQAVDMLEETAGLSATLIDAYSIPLDTEEILKIGDDCRGQILVVEDNFAGGIGDEICAAAATSDLGVTVRTMYVKDMPKSAKTAGEIMEMASLSPKNIADAAQEMFDGSVA
jgi:transketolase